jgi:DNA-binding LacI/PurR family transcriptional regulator
MGLRIPDDLAVVGFDNVSYSDYFGVPLTTIEQDRHEIGAVAAALLLDRMAGRRTRASRTIISTRLIVRGSSNSEQKEGSKSIQDAKVVTTV